MYGRNVTEKTHIEPLNSFTPSSYERFLRQKLASLIYFVEENKVESQKRQKDYYDRTSKKYSRHIVDDPVLLSVPHVGVSSKHDDRWEAGWKITDVIGPANVSIQHLDGRNRVVNINRLQPHRQRSSFINESQRPINEYTTTKYSLTGESATSRPVIQYNTRSSTLELRKQKDMDHSERYERNKEDETTNSLN